jgi:hypothetical protein
MNKSNLKKYAPAARRDFIASVTQRAQLLGISLGVGGAQAGKVLAEPCEVHGEVALIAGRPWPAHVQGQREMLLERFARDGYHATLEAIAYTWFNRLAALRYMELHDYLGHGRRVLSHPEGGLLPEALAHALELAENGDLPGLRADKVRELKLTNQDGELYRRVLLSQCNALHRAMPFLFERLDDETELLLPDNLLLSDAIVAKLVVEIPEEDWTEVEAIGWLYQFYISEKKDEVIGKVVKSEDIPAATQLFTPNWIVQYLVQNSVGRLWLMANPTSLLASQWPYYIQPAEQTPEVQAQLDALIQTRIREDGEALNPESITVLDPACGSGHILVVAYDVLKAIYLERGYQPRAIPRLILEKNLYGLDIDDRAAQLAAFALLMKARADDRRLFNDPPKLNVLSLQESKGLDAAALTQALNAVRATAPTVRAELVEAHVIRQLLTTFEHAKTFGSLIQIPPALTAQLALITPVLQQALQSGDLYAQQAAKDVLPLVWQVLVLGMQFDAVVTNPPYMGGKGMNQGLKDFATENFESAKSDLFAMFIERGFGSCKSTGFLGMVTMQNWMFLSSFEVMRSQLLANRTISNLIQIGYNSFPELNSKVAQACAFSLMVRRVEKYSGCYVDLNSASQSADKRDVFLCRTAAESYNAIQNNFSVIPGNPIAYWLSERVRRAFLSGTALEKVASPRQGLATGENARFVRSWSEVSASNTSFRESSVVSSFASLKRWFPYNKGGDSRKRYGNQEFLVDWESDGKRIRTFFDDAGKLRSRPQNTEHYFKSSVSWSKISSGIPSFRYFPSGFIFDVAGTSIFSDDNALLFGILGFSNSIVARVFLQATSPTLNLEVGHICALPFKALKTCLDCVGRAVDISRADWDHFEVSWGFVANPMVMHAGAAIADIGSESSDLNGTIQKAWQDWAASCVRAIEELRHIEEVNNRLFIEAYGLQDELRPDVTADQITLARADREKDCQRLISYAIGCIMGRYSLDEPGLIYAHANNVGFDPSRYEKKFPADDDGIVPITFESWFEDDAASRVREFVRAVWGAETLEENMVWLAESLGAKGGETADETIRRYLADKFFKDHLQTYKKRPIYWLFSSGKLGAFQAIVYLHRYFDGTLARMRAEYVLPLIGKLQTRVESLEADILSASSTAARTKLNKQLEKLKKQHLELHTFEEKLRHHADMRISLDLDDGVKVNYGKFGDLLAEVKAITGGKDDE